MFTGITLGCATVVAREAHAGGMRLLLRMPAAFWVRGAVAKGASVACDGCCLTATAGADADGDGTVGFDMIGETCARTTLAQRRVGDAINIERPLRGVDEQGGHVVSGHVSCTVQVVARPATAAGVAVSLKLAVGADEAWGKYVFAKGFIAVNGVSLTVGAVEADGFWVHLIPETLAVTNLGALRVGDGANLEVDSMTVATVETVERYLAGR